MSPSAHDRMNSLWRQGFSGWDSCLPWVFKGNPMNLDRGYIGADYGHPKNLDCNRGHSGDDCGNIHWDLLSHRDFMFRGWVGSGFGMNGVALGNACCRSFAMD